MISGSTNFNGLNLMDGSVTSISFQVGADNSANDSISVDLVQVDTTELGVTGSVATADDATALIDSIDAALDTVSGARGSYGAVQNRLTSTVSNLMNISENLSAANGRIVDADFAAETSNMTKQQILSQAGVAMLAQAKALPQQVMQLLQ